MLGLVLTAGGARGAYQAGVLQRIAEIPGLRERPSPFAIVTGASAGAINGTALAARSVRFGDACIDIARLWSELRIDRVFRSDVPSLLSTGASLARDFVLGGLLGHTVTTGCFDTSPLDELLQAVLLPHGIDDAIRRGHLYAVAVTATSYHSGRSYTFVQGREGHPIWNKSRRVVQKASLGHRHVMASAAIPILFPPVRVDSRAGAPWFGDGALRLVAPMSPAIRLGASRVLAIGIRSSKAAASLAHEEAGGTAPVEAEGSCLTSPPLAQICGVFFNAIFLDHLDADLEHLRRMNELLDSHIPEAAHPVRGGAGAGANGGAGACGGTGSGVNDGAGANGAAARQDGSGANGAAAMQDGAGTNVDEDAAAVEGMRRIEALAISPSEDLALIAQRFAHRMPRLLRYVMDGLGIPDAQSADLTSYLLFDSMYTRTLVDIGWRDADARIDEIEAFVREAEPLAAPVPEAPRLVRPLAAAVRARA